MKEARVRVSIGHGTSLKYILEFNTYTYRENLISVFWCRA